MIDLAPVVPLWLAAPALVAVGLALWRLRGGAAPSALRLIVCAGTAGLLLNPVRFIAAPQGEPPRLALVCDTSASMGLDQRAALAQQALAEVRSRVAGFRCEAFVLADALAPGSATGTSGGTSFDDLARLATGTPPAAIILASDGAERGDAPPDAALAAAQVPVFAIAIPGAPAANAAVRIEPDAPTAFPGARIAATVVVTATAPLHGRQAELTITGPGAPPPQVVTLADSLRITLDLPAGSQPGPAVWGARLAALPGESTADDNQGATVVQIVDRRLRLLVLEGRPNWDTAFAVRAWRTDRQLETVAAWRIGSRTHTAGSATGPRLGDAGPLDTDIVVLGSETTRLLTDAQAAGLAAWCAQGGGIVLLGRDERPAALTAVDPALWREGPGSELAPRVQPAARRLGLCPADARLGRLLCPHAIDLRPGADVALGEATQPAVVVGRHGAGRVIAVAASGWWRLQLQAPDAEARTQVERLWCQLAKAAAAEAGGLRPDRLRYRVGTTARIACADGPLTVTAPDGGVGGHTAVGGELALPLSAAGIWRVQQGDALIAVPVEPDARELAEAAPRPDRLARLADATGGALIAPEQAAALAERLNRRAELRLDAPRSEPILPTAWMALVLVALATAAWWLHRRRGGI